uniref:ACT domain-containing protein n=1 Tax=Aegilops tauschii subsp. strangulata TaxID=200361 RepID=A0A452XND4_AEGTS
MNAPAASHHPSCSSSTTTEKKTPHDTPQFQPDPTTKPNEPRRGERAERIRAGIPGGRAGGRAMPMAGRSSGRGGGGRTVLGGRGGGPGVEDAVVMELAAGDGEDNVVTVNCPDQAGLGCDLCRTILEFGLRITRGGEPSTSSPLPNFTYPPTMSPNPQREIQSPGSIAGANCVPRLDSSYHHHPGLRTARRVNLFLFQFFFPFPYVIGAVGVD